MPVPSTMDWVSEIKNLGERLWGLLAAVPLLAWMLSLRAQKQKEKADTRKETADARTADQKSLEMVYERLDKIERRSEINSNKIEKLQDEKMQLHQEILLLKQQIAMLEIKKEHYVSNEVMYLAQIADLEERLSAKGEELRRAEERLAALESRQDL